MIYENIKELGKVQRTLDRIKEEEDAIKQVAAEAISVLNAKRRPLRSQRKSLMALIAQQP